MKSFKIVALNLGSTSSKIAFFVNDDCIFKETIAHSASDLIRFDQFWDQEEYRTDAVKTELSRRGVDLGEIDAYATWGGHGVPVKGGVYRVIPELFRQTLESPRSKHPSDLTPKVAFNLAGGKAPVFSIDPPTVDEFAELARLTGVPGIKRKSLLHSLNQKAVARAYAESIGRHYSELKLVVVHMGGGISVAAHNNGRMVDANNGLDGDGPMAGNRAGTVPAGDLIDLCFSGKYSHGDVRKMVTGNAGLVAYLGESDGRIIEKRIAAGDSQAKLVYDTMIYQISKEIGSMSTVLHGQINAVLLTGGMANSAYITEGIKARVGWIAPIEVYPGELEMESLGKMALRALRGEEKVRDI